MDKIITYGMNENFIGRLADLLKKEFYSKNKDASRIACVFGGRRPALFLKKELAKRIGTGFIPPKIFSIDSFMEYLVSPDTAISMISELDACYHVYKIARRDVPKFLNAEKSFNDFMPWAKEIISFIEQIDIENIDSKKLTRVEKSAEIGFDVPKSINEMLENISGIREKYHGELKKSNKYSRGLIYLEASKLIQGKMPDDFDKIIFCNFFYLQGTEKEVITEICRKGKGICVFQGSHDDWPVLKKDAEILGARISPEKAGTVSVPDIEFYQGQDLHAQVCLVRNAIKKINENEREDTVIVVPNPEAIIPLISEIGSELKDFNISMGYSIKRSPLYALFELLYKVQESRREEKYYAKDYLNMLRHPLVKNLRIVDDFSVTRVVIHKLEESLQGFNNVETSITGNLFIGLKEVEKDQTFYKLASDTLNNMGIKVSTDDCINILKTLNKMLFEDWSEIKTMKEFGENLTLFLDKITDKSSVGAYSFNIKIMESLYGIAEEMRNCFFSEEKFKTDDIWNIFMRKIENEVISFSGSPLRGTQILGFLETRSLNFKNVIIMDVNESLLPKLKLHEALIPREIMLILGLNRLSKEEEIQRYYFKRLISGARKVYLVYEENRKKERSRFIEEIIWEEQKKQKKMDVFKPKQAEFRMEPKILVKEIRKTPAMIKYLKEATYSASRLNKYMECPLWFYYEYVLGLKEKENMLDDPDAAQVGTFFHELLEDGYNRFIGKAPIIDGEFESYLKIMMDKKFEAELKPRMKSDWFLLKTIMDTRFKSFIDNERDRSGNIKKVLELESDQEGKIKLEAGEISFVYKIDRIDELQDGSLLVIDYKTGTLGNASKPKSFKSLDVMEFSRESILGAVKSFQLPLYNYFISERYPDKKINSALYSLRDIDMTSFISKKDSDNGKDIMDVCKKSMDFILKEIFNPDIPFKPTAKMEDERRCGYCPFKGLCA